LKNIASIVSTNIVHVNEWKARVKRSTITSKVKVGSLRVKACFKLGDQGCQCLSALLICHFAYPGSTGTLVAVGTEDAIFWVAVLGGMVGSEGCCVVPIWKGVSPGSAPYFSWFLEHNT
jgi:hypothetical protein